MKFRTAIYNDACNAISKAFNLLYSELRQENDENVYEVVGEIAEETKRALLCYIEQQKNALFAKRSMGNNPNAVDCMTQHVKIFFGQACKEESADFAKPCEECPYRNVCNLEWLNIMEPLLSQADIQIYGKGS